MTEAAFRSEAFVDGRFVSAADGRTFDCVTPRDGSVLASVTRGDVADIDRAVAAARRAFNAGGWADADPAQRGRVLIRLSELIFQHAERLAEIESRDTGHPISDARNVDVPGAARCFAWYGQAVDKVYGEIAPTAADALALIGREPLGVVGAVGVVVPWNYPLIITAWKLAPALAAGNSVVLKPAEQSPLSALALAELAAEAGIPDGVLNVVPGFGEEAGQALGRHPDVDKLAFTGSVEVGRLFQRYAGESNGKQVSLELGGKSPQVVLADAADLQTVAEAIGWGIFYNAGQTCHAGSRVVVQEPVADELRERLCAVAAGFVPGDPASEDTALGALISAEHLENVHEHVRNARNDGAAIVYGDENTVPPVAGGAYMGPMLIDSSDDPARAIVQDEVFRTGADAPDRP
jgi:acyl-CoA reductase-like NAD-dependent aldehyde dehydrogenase